MKQHTRPCKECPFSRNCKPGETGGAHPFKLLGQAAGPFVLNCHMAPDYTSDGTTPDLEKRTACAGAAVFRANMGWSESMPGIFLKLGPDDVAVFSSMAGFCGHHLDLSVGQARQRIVEAGGVKAMLDAEIQEAARKGLIRAVKVEGT